MEDDMKLPEGKTAEECWHFNKCSKMFGCKAKNVTCDFAPSRFLDASMPPKISKEKK